MGHAIYYCLFVGDGGEHDVFEERREEFDLNVDPNPADTTRHPANRRSVDGTRKRRKWRILGIRRHGTEVDRSP